MAKRKKLNRRLVILLAACGMLVACGVMAAALRWLPKDAAAHAARGEKALREGRAGLERGDAALAARRFGVARAEYAEAVGADKANPAYPYKLAELQWAWAGVPGLSRTDADTHRAAAEHWATRALQRQGDHVPTLRLLCQIRWDAHAARPFIDAATRLIEHEPDAQTHFRRGIMREAFIRVDADSARRALEDFRKAVELAPAEVVYWQRLLMFLAEHDPPAVDAAFAEALAAAPGSAVLQASYGEHLLARWAQVERRKASGDLSGQERQQAEQWRRQAEQRFRRADALEPGLAIGKAKLGKLLLLEGKFAAAREQLEAARKIDADAYEVHRLLAEVYERLGETEALTATFREALRTLPEIPPKDVATEQAKQQRERLLGEQRRWHYGLAVALTRPRGALAGPAGGEERARLTDEASRHLRVLEQMDPDFPQRAYLEARIAFADGDADEAIRILEQADRQGNADRAAIDMLISLCMGPYPRKAEKQIDRYLQRDPKNPNLLVYKAQLAIRYRQYTDAAGWIKKALAVEPDNARALNFQRVLEVLTDRTARLPAEAAIAAEGDYLVDVLRGHAAWLSARGRGAEAAALLADLHAKAPDDRGTILALVALQRRLNRDADVQALLAGVREAHQGQGDWQRFVDSVAAVDPGERFDREMAGAEGIADPFDRAIAKARICFAHERDEPFRVHFAAAAALKPADADVVNLRFEQLLRQPKIDEAAAAECIALAEKHNLDGAGGRGYKARLAWVQQRYADAVGWLEEVLAEHPARKRARTLLGSCHLGLREFAEAERAFRMVVENDPSYAPAVVGLTRTLSFQPERHREFEYWVGRASRLAPSHPAVKQWQLRLAEAEVGDDRLEPFIQKRLKLEQESPEDADNLVRLAWLYERAGQFPQAEKHYLAFAKASPDRLGGAVALGGFYVRRGRHDEVARLFEAVAADMPEGAPRAAAHLAYAQLIAAADGDRARRAYDRAIALAGPPPEGTFARQAKAKFLAERGELKAAAELMAECVQAEPRLVRPRMELVGLLLRTGEEAAAARRLDEALMLAPKLLDALVLRAALAQRAGQPAEAEALLNRAVEADEFSADARLARVDLYLGQRRTDEARRELRDAPGVERSAEIATRYGYAWLGLADADPRALEEAGRLFRRARALALQAGTSPVRAVEGLIRVYIQTSQWGLARQEVEAALGAFPREPGLHVLAATLHRARNDPAGELAALQRARELSPDSPEIARACLDAQVRAGQARDALATAARYAGRDGFGAWLDALRARAHAKLNEPDEAERLFVSAIRNARETDWVRIMADLQQAYGAEEAARKLAGWVQQRPQEAAVHAMLGDLWAEAGDSAAAVAAYKSAAPLASTARQRIGLLSTIGTTHHKAGELAEAAKAYEQVLRLDPGNVQVLNNLAYIYADDRDEPEKALPYAERAAKARPADACVLDTYGWVLAKLGQYEPARRELAKAVALSEGVAGIRYHLAWVHEKLAGQAEAASSRQTHLDAAAEHYSLAKRQAENESKQAPALCRNITEGLERVRKAIGSPSPR